LGEKGMAKSLLVFTLNRVIYFVGTNFRGLFKTSLHWTKYNGDLL
jgi:hypothetical protein